LADSTTGVLVMAYGTPGSPDEVEAYYTHIRRGRPPTPEQLADLMARYDAIGGISPLAERTRAQADGLQRQLDQRGAARGDAYAVALGNKHAPPFIEDGVASLLDAGVARVIGLVLAPHYSALSVGEYHERGAAATAAAASIPYVGIDSWHVEPVLVQLLADRVGAAFGHLVADGRRNVEVLFTAHSLPERILAMGDPYPRQLEETAAAVAGATGLDHWRVAWQSAGRTPEPWIGPDIRDVISALPTERPGVDAVVVCPAGFVSDHLEVCYDVDIEARRVAEDAGLALARTASLNDDPAFLTMLAGVVARAVEGAR
jgi:ferrochelatase